ncbi:hypothetical protein ACLMJK_001777 [Lecanora helva]
MPQSLRPLILPLSHFRTQRLAPQRILALRPLHPTPHHSPPRFYSSQPPPPTSPQEPKSYTFTDLTTLTNSSPDPSRLLIDVREPRELAETGRIPGAVNMPIQSNPDAFYLGEEDFRERFGFERPRARGREGGGKEGMSESPYSGKMKEREARSRLGGEGVDSMGVNEEAGGRGVEEDGQGVDEVIFYCKAGVRSRAAARLAREWQGVRVGQYEEGWLGWEGNGGRVER